MKRTGIILILLVVLPLLLSDCKKELPPKEQDFYVVDISSETDWDYWFVVKDGGCMFIQTQNGKPSIIFYQPEKNKSGYPIFLDSYGVPIKAVINDNIFLFGNYAKSTVDISVIKPDGNIVSFAGIAINQDFTSFYSKGESGIQWQIDNIIKYAGWAAGAVSCVAGLAATIPTAGLSLGLVAIGCGSTAVSIASDLLLPEDYEVIGMSSDVIGIAFTFVGCPANTVECFFGILESASSIYGLAKQRIENNQENEQKANSILTTGLKVTTNNATDITGTSVVLNGNVEINSNITVNERGFYWGTIPNPKDSGEKLSAGNSCGSYNITLNQLSPNQTYYIIAYATSNKGTNTGDEVNFKTITLKPLVSTQEVEAVSSNLAIVGGNVINDGGAVVTERGVYWGELENPELTGNKLQIGEGNGTFSTTIASLKPENSYYVKAYATNSQGTGFGEQIPFVTPSNNLTSTVTDIDGNVYNTVPIGTQVWMAENLKTSKYRNGEAITTGLTDTQWYTTTSGAYAIYNNDNLNNTLYGKLYNYYSVADSRNLCPTGWHVPNKIDFDQMINYLGGITNAFPKLIQEGSSGFNVLLGGHRDYPGNYAGIGSLAIFWSSSNPRWFVSLTPSNQNITWASPVSTVSSNRGFSIRCVKD